MKERIRRWLDLKLGNIGAETADRNIADSRSDFFVYHDDGRVKAFRKSDRKVLYERDRANELLVELTNDFRGEPLRIELDKGEFEVEYAQLFLDSHQGIVGQGIDQTVLYAPASAPRPAHNGNVGLVNMYGGLTPSGVPQWGVNEAVDDIIVEAYCDELTIDGNNRNGAGGGQSEGVEMDAARLCSTWRVKVFDCVADNWDLDDCEQNRVIECTADQGGDGFHCSSNAHLNTFRDCYATGCRVGFTQQNGAYGNIYSGIRAENNGANFDISTENQTGGAARVTNPQVIDSNTSQFGDFTGVSGGLPIFPFMLREDFGYPYNGGADGWRGRTTFGQYHEYEVFDDNPKTALYRMQWDLSNAANISENGYLEIDGGASGFSAQVEFGQETRDGQWDPMWEYGEVIIEFQWPNGPSDSGTSSDWGFLRDSSDRYDIFIHGSRADIELRYNGDADALIAGNWDGDDERHTIRVTRDPDDTWELFYDGTSLGTTVFSETPRSTEWVLSNGNDEPLRIHRLEMR